MKPLATEHSPYFKKYIDLVADENLNVLFLQSEHEFEQFILKIPADKADYKYAENKWTTKQVLMHVIDCERIFAYRALCIARGEIENLPGFDENNYALNCAVMNRNMSDILIEFLAVREATMQLFKHFSEADLCTIGRANNAAITPNAISYIIIGHQVHHLNVLAEKYV